MNADNANTTSHDPLSVLSAATTPGWNEPLAPAHDFAEALRRRLERGVSLPEGVDMDTAQLEHELTASEVDAPAPQVLVERPGALPYLTVRDARSALDWYVERLGATVRGEPILMDDNTIGHAELEVGGGVIYLAEEFPDMGLRGPQPGAVSVSLMLAVDDTDEALRRTAAGGAAVTREPYEAYGTRTATIVDPFGHRWMLTGPTLAAQASTSKPPAARIRHGDIGFISVNTHDAARARAFYGAVLGWEFDDEVRMVTTTSHPTAVVETSGPQTIFCAYAVDDLDAARRRIEAAGGTTRDDRHGLDCVDDQGVEFAVYVAAPDEPRAAQHPRGVGEMSYLTVHTRDSARLREFYGTALGWTFTPGRIADGWEVDDAHPQIGIAGGADSDVAVPMWNVDDVDAAVERVRAAGGSVISEPDRAAYGVVALCADDQGAQFYLGQLF